MSGGTTMFKNITEGLFEEVKNYIITSIKFKVTALPEGLIRFDWWLSSLFAVKFPTNVDPQE